MARREIEREFLLPFWKLHILHHAGEEPVVGLWMIKELQRHGYDVSPGTVYPLLARMERRGWLRSRVASEGARRHTEYTLTAAGRRVLRLLRGRLEELYAEVVLGEDEEAPRAKPADRRPVTRPERARPRPARKTRRTGLR